MSNAAMENYNFWNDSRTIAGMVPKPTVQKTKNGTHILYEKEDDDGVITVHWLKTKWEVCGTCKGEGKHVNAAVDSGGLTAEDFRDDPDFQGDYVGGAYDVTCNECKGRTTVAVVCDTDPLAKEYQQHRTDLYNDAAASAAERAMGA